MMNKPDEIHNQELDDNLRVKDSIMLQERPQIGVTFDNNSDRGMVRRFQLKALAIGSDDIADNSITGPKIVSNAISNTKIASFDWNKGTGGTISAATINADLFLSGTINNSIVGTPNITGGTATSIKVNNPTIGTPALTGGTLTPTLYKFGTFSGISATVDYLTAGTVAGTLIFEGGLLISKT